MPKTLLERVKRRPKKRIYVLWVFLGMMSLLLIGLLFFLVTFWTYADGLIVRDRLVNRQFRGLIMYDKNGEVIYESGVQYRTGNVPIAQIPQTLRDATVAVEDKDFYRHIGFSIPAMIRAFFANTQEGEVVQGASTITQQLVKNALLGDASVRYVRKIREVALAFAIEYRYSKEELLELYLNSIYYGRSAWGVNDAAQQYFGKQIQDLTDEEAIYLAGLPQAPSVYGAENELARERQRQVIQAMMTQGYIDQTRAMTILDSPISLIQFRPFSVRYPFFTLTARTQLFDLLQITATDDDDAMEQLVNRGVYVYTSFDPTIQELSEQQVREGVDALRDRNVTNGAAIVLDAPTGAVRAMVGSRDWFDDSNGGKFNVLYSMQQPGSTLKPLIYAAALDQGIIRTNSILKDVRTNYSGYVPVNYDGRYRGDVTVRRALANSLNAPIVEVLNDLGIQSGVEYLVNAGMVSLKNNVPDENYAQHYGLSLVLGGYEVTPVEVVGAYGVLARGGTYTKPYLIDKVVDRFGATLYQHQVTATPVYSRGTSEFIYDVLSDNDARRESFGSRASNLEVSGKRVAVKTGTTTDYRDSWAVGYNGNYVVGVWVGNNDNSPMNEVAGSVGGASVWKRIFEQL